MECVAEPVTDSAVPLKVPLITLPVLLCSVITKLPFSIINVSEFDTYWILLSPNELGVYEPTFIEETIDKPRILLLDLVADTTICPNDSIA